MINKKRVKITTMVDHDQSKRVKITTMVDHDQLKEGQNYYQD